MKRFYVIFLTPLLFGCVKEQNPSNYEGCVVTDKSIESYSIQVKLAPRYKLYKHKGKDYVWFHTVKYEYDRLNIGDTIK